MSAADSSLPPTDECLTTHRITAEWLARIGGQAAASGNITANAVQGRGGNIQINTQGIFRSPDSSITASSQLGINGIVQIKTLGINPSLELVNLPVDLDVQSELRKMCPGMAGKVELSRIVSGGRDPP